jgi:hypothetical protein
MQNDDDNATDATTTTATTSTVTTATATTTTTCHTMVIHPQESYLAGCSEMMCISLDHMQEYTNMVDAPNIKPFSMGKFMFHGYDPWKCRTFLHTAAR